MEKTVEKPVIQYKYVEKPVIQTVERTIEKPVVKRVVRVRYLRNPVEFAVLGAVCLAIGVVIGLLF